MIWSYLLISAIIGSCIGDERRENFVGYLSQEAVEDYKNFVRIINGEPVLPGDVPYQAGILITVDSGGTGLCGGSLITNNRILTAAHCWYDGINQGLMVQVVLGGTRINEFELGSVRQNTDEVYTHPSWFPYLIRNDIAVVYLPSPITFTYSIQPVGLPTGSEIEETFTGEMGIASGWGITSNSGSISHDLLSVEMRIISNTICGLTSPILVNEDNICTSSLNGGAVCNGDSGGPLVVDRNGRKILVGITSFRHLTGCESIFPSMFVRVTRYIDWIYSHVG